MQKGHIMDNSASALKMKEVKFKTALPDQKWLMAAEMDAGRLKAETARMETGLIPLRICEATLPLRFDAWVQAFDDHLSYFVIPKSLQPLLDDLCKQMTETYNSRDIPALSQDTISVGDLCVAEFESEDGKFWYRGRVEATDDGLATVFFVDFGNTETKPAAELKQMLADFACFPALALECCEIHFYYGADDFRAAVAEADCSVHCELFSCASPPYGARLSNPLVSHGTQFLAERSLSLIHPTEELIQQLEAQRLEKETQAKVDAEMKEYAKLCSGGYSSSGSDLEEELERTAKNAAPSHRYLRAREMAELAGELKGATTINFPPPSVPPEFFEQANRIRRMRRNQRPSCIFKYENKSSLNKPMDGCKLPVLVSHVKNARDIFLLSPKGEDQARTAESVLASNYEDDSESVPPEELVECRACVVRDQSLDGRWIRAVVVWAKPGEGVTVRAIDRGWTLPPIPWSHVAGIKVLRTIDSTYDGPACWHLKLVDVCRGSPSAAEEILKSLLVEGKMVRVEFSKLPAGRQAALRGYPGDIWDLPLEAKKPLSKKVASKMKKQGIRLWEPASRSLSEQSPLVACPTMSTWQLENMVLKGSLKLSDFRIPDAQWSGQNELPVTVSYFESPWKLFLQTEKMWTKLQDLNRSLNERYERELRLEYNTLSSLFPTEIGEGVFCVGRFVDGFLYRVLVLAVDQAQEACQVQYVDYGNRSVVPFDQLFMLRPEFAQQSRLCLGPCVLNGVPQRNDICDDVFKEMEAMATTLLCPLRRLWMANLRQAHVDGKNYFLLALRDPEGKEDANEVFYKIVNR